MADVRGRCATRDPAGHHRPDVLVPRGALIGFDPEEDRRR